MNTKILSPIIVAAALAATGARAYADIAATHLSWSAAHHVITQAHCPVLTIRE